MTSESTESWYCLRSGPGESALNMAVDEVLLQAASRLGRPLLRFYGWREAAATFGYFQKYAEVQGMTALRPLLRRPTGGGLVPHDADWTYSLVFPPAHAWYALRAATSYQRLHEWLRQAFHRLGRLTTLARVPQPDAPGQCFGGAELSDLLWDNRKIAGAAQRRSRHGLLIQGSVQPPPDSDRSSWEQSMCDVAAQEWHVAWTPCDLAPDLDRRARTLAASKYGAPDYNRRR